ncbi:MAG: hypothetical protein HYT76_10300 [Deltaproteobacteria bacterium]|nr:hypothetical protein [Deltaproteobacteria bacterium]
MALTNPHQKVYSKGGKRRRVRFCICTVEKSDLPIRVDLLERNSISDEFRKVIEENYEIIS